MFARETAGLKSRQMPEVLSREEGKTLLSLCRSGRLYEVEKWIAAGKSLRVPPECRRSPLRVALENGFHSLIDLLARHVDQETKDAALRQAVGEAKVDFVEVLLAQGANLKSVPFHEVLFSWNPKLIRLFLAGGADPISGAPFAHAFAAKIRTAIGIFLEQKRAHPELAEQFEEQVDRALRHFCEKGDLKWVSLMLWAGANPRAKGPTLDEKWADDPESFITALEAACYAQDVAVLKRLKPDPQRDDLASLLRSCAGIAREDTVKYLLELGANPNDRTDGGSTALNSCLTHFSWESFNLYRQQKPRYAVHRTLACIKALVEHGAQWKPEGKRDMNWVRRALLECEPSVTIDVVQLLRRNNACSEETIRGLILAPTMKTHLASQQWHLSRLKMQLEDPKKKAKREPPAALMERFNREELYEKVWAEPTRTVARSYGVSDVWLSKVCKWLQVPVPGRGYWAKKAAGKPVRKRPVLPQQGKSL